MPEKKQETPCVPRLRFPEFRDAGEWEVKRLGKVCEILDNMRKPVTSTKRKPGPYPYYGASGAIDYIDKYIFEERLLLIGEDGAKWGPFERTAFIVEGKYWVNNHAHVLRPTQINDVLLENYLNATDVSVYVTGAAPPKLTLDNLKAIHIPVSPKREEQQKIADCLSSLDEVIDGEAQKLDALRTHKKGLMQDLFPREGETTPRLRFPEFRDAREWKVKRIGDIFRVTRGEVLSMKVLSGSPSTETPYPVYSSQTKNNGLAGYYSDYLYKDAITWTTDGANAGDVKYRKGKFYCTNVCGVLISEDGYANSFVAELLNTVTKRHVSYVGNPKLMNGVMARIQIPFPQIDEQQKIADCLSSLDAVIEAQTKKIEALKTHKKGLMQQLFPQEVA